ncbi:MAG TPA: SDR family oxidoreductase [Stellaceae bacterium]|nr:SDR family oxidoreductase [Stellaceae bacterium]
MSAFDLGGDVFLVTGAAGGIGRAIVAALAAAGGTVIGTDLCGEGDIVAHDVTSEADWARIAAHVAERHGRLAGLVNNAGYALTESVEATSLEAWRRVQSINVESMLIGLHAMLPLLRKGAEGRTGGASVVNFSSVGGLRGAAFCAAYCASKAAVAMLTKCAAIEFAALKYGIRVNSVHPGGIETPMMDSIFRRYVALGAVPSEEAARAATGARHPLGRLGKPEEIAGGVVYLCSPAAAFVTASELVIDGGFTSM